MDRLSIQTKTRFCSQLHEMVFEDIQKVFPHFHAALKHYTATALFECGNHVQNKTSTSLGPESSSFVSSDPMKHFQDASSFSGMSLAYISLVSVHTHS